MSDIRFAAKAYLDEGWAIVPIVPGEKKAAGQWQKKTYAVAHFERDDNLAGKCGEPSGWRVDVDCDVIEACAAARALLPKTELIHGRPGKPDSHYWYIAEGAKTAQFTDVQDATGAKNMLVELRSTGGYTVLPPSIWTSKDGTTTEEMAWAVNRTPARINAEDLLASVRYVATATLLAKHYPGAGARHHFAGHLAGFLASAKVPDFLIIEVIRVAATLAGDPDVHDRVTFAQGTLAKFAAGVPITGGPKLAECVGPDVVAKLRGWYRLVDTDALEAMNAKHFIVTMGKDTVIGREDHPGGVLFQTKKALELEYANKFCAALDRKGQPTQKPLLDEWVKSSVRRSYTRVVFAPPPAPCEPGDYNLWTGFAVQPAEDDRLSCDRFLEHAHDVICDGETAHFEFLMNLLAATVQAPGRPIGIATVLRGGQGSGKGLFVRTIGDLFGRRHYIQLDKVEQLAGKFNAALSGKIIVFADEAFFAGDKREVGALKRLITEPTLAIERKGVDITSEDNHVHLFMATNERWSWPAAIDDRRGFLLKVSDARAGDHAYFDAIAKELDNGGRRALLKHLLDRTVDWTALKHAPKTAERRAQQNISLDGHLAWWMECLYEGSLGTLGWQQFIPARAIFELYREWCQQNRRRHISNIEFGRTMGRFLNGAAKSRVKRSGKDMVRGYDLRPLKDARDYFDAELGTTENWPEVGDPGAQTNF
jgi:hypothetical protein